MKKINYLKNRGLWFFVLMLPLFLFTQCDKEIEVYNTEDLQINENYPDLRYRDVDDSYSFLAVDAVADTFEVKSLYHEWKIIGISEDQWCKISPQTGDADSLYEVKIVPEENTSLDDRIDTFSIESKDWTGKTFVVFQKGTAYLNTEVDNQTLAEYVGSITNINVKSNQDWKAVIADDIDWMDIDGTSEGNGDGVVSLITTKSNGSLRKDGMVYFYDRNDILSDSVKIYQQGLYLEVVESPDQIGVDGGAAIAKLSSNTSWQISIPESAQSWISVDKTSGNNDATINFTMISNFGPFRSAYVYIKSVPELVEDSILINQIGSIPFTEDYFNKDNATFNSDGSATLYAAPKTGSKKLTSKINDFSYGKYTVEFENIQIAVTSSTMLMCITKEGNQNGGISWGANANPKYSDGWASEYWISDAFGSKIRKRLDNDILRADIKKYIIDIRKSDTEGMIDIDFYINDELQVSETGLDGFANGDPYTLTFWIYNYYDHENAAIFQPLSLIYEPYKY